MRELEPIIVDDLFPEVLDRLLGLLSGLSSQDWNRPTVCPSWSVKDVAAHLLGDEIGILSRKRDGFSPSSASLEGWEELVAYIDDINERWVKAMHRVSPRLLCDLLASTGRQACDYFSSLDPYAIGGPVSWAGPEPAPVWLDLAREYTERWHHQQHIRDAVGKQGLKEPRFLAPVLDTLVRALPHAYRQTTANDGTIVAFTITGESGGRWFLRREGRKWKLYLAVSGEPSAVVVVDEDAAWRIFTRGLSRSEAKARVDIAGDQSLGERFLDTVSIIA